MANRRAPWALMKEITGGCLSHQGTVCRNCGEFCGVDAISYCFAAGGITEPIIDADFCTGCGDCVASCPTMAIVVTPIAAEKPDAGDPA
jgi:ferredoxin-type protein NapF